MNLPATLTAALEDTFGQPIELRSWVGGGDINQAARITSGRDDYFLKWNNDAPDGMFAAEARGLALLQQADTLRVPQVIQSGDQFLVLEWLDFTGTRPANALGEGLANLHQQTDPQHGLDHDNFIGRLPQPNTQSASWVTFYGEQRIRAQMHIARQRRRLPSEREKLLEKLIQKLPNLLPNAQPSLLHGDLWGGNYGGLANDVPVIYDPAVYYGHREIDLAMTELFGGFPRGFYDAYKATFPLEPGYPERKALYQLYPLMVHMNLFGGGYGSSVDSIVRRYVS